MIECNIKIYNIELLDSIIRGILSDKVVNPDDYPTIDEIAQAVINSCSVAVSELPIDRIKKDLPEVINDYIKETNDKIDKLKRTKEEKEKLKQELKDEMSKLQDSIFTKIGVPVNSGPPINTDENPTDPTDEENNPKKIRKEKARVVLKRIFGTSLGPMSYWESVFSKDAFGFTCAGNGTLITNDKELNVNIAKKKNEYYNKIRLELLRRGYSDVSRFPSTIYDSKGNINEGFEYILRLYEAVVLPDLNQDKLRFLWAKTLTGEELESGEFNALISYVSLRYFDTLLKYKLGKVVSINKDSEDNIEQPVFENKYSFSASINELARGWETAENQDALERSSNFSKMLVENITMRNYKTGRPEQYNISTTQFAFAFTNLFNVIVMNSSDNEKFKTYIYKMHSNPKKYIKKILKDIFIGNQSENLRKKLIEFGLSELDLNVLYSVFRGVFNVEDLVSDKELKKQFSDDESFEKIEISYMINANTPFIPNQYPLVECITGLVDRMMGVNYLEYQVNQDGKLELVIKKKFNSIRAKIRLKQKINQMNSILSDDQRTIYDNQYNFEETSNSNEWSFIVGEQKFRVTSKSNLLSDEEIEITDDKGNKYDFNELPDLINYDKSPELRLILKFIQDSLYPLKIFGEEKDINRLILAQTLNKENIIRQLFISAVRSGIINKIHLKYSKSNSAIPFHKWVEINIDELQGTLSNKNIWNITSTRHELSVVKMYDKWIDSIVTADSIIRGDLAKSTIKDITGNSIGNFSISFLGGNIYYYLNQAKENKFPDPELNTAQQYLLGARDSGLIAGVLINLDSSNQEKTQSKLTKTMNLTELSQQAIFHNFYDSFFGDGETKGKYMIQPTTYSDKTKFVQYAIQAMYRTLSLGDPSRKYFNKTIHQLDSEAFEELYMDTVGEFYKTIFNNTVSKLRRVLGLDDTATYKDVLAELENHSNKYKENSERELIKLAQEKGITLYLHSDYIVSGGRVQFNPLLDYYNNWLFSGSSNLREKFKREQLNFANDLLEANSIFYIRRLDGKTNTNIGDIVDKIFKNIKSNKFAIYSILKELGLPEDYDIDKNPNAIDFRSEFDKRWVDDNKLIIAKQIDKTNGRVIRNYTFGDTIPTNSDVQLNPLLEHFFYANSVLGNNLRLSLTGSELSHPIKWKSKIPNPALGVDYSDPIYNRLESITQGAQLKRNVIIPATLQYFQQNTMTGVPSKLKISVFRDAQATVFNYSGNQKSIDGSDGSGYSNSLITIIENKSLQDQAVGSIKKTIAHSPNYETGGTFLGKWAIFGITSEHMRNSINAKISLYEVDKKLLNIQWYNNNGQTGLDPRFFDQNIMKDKNIDLSVLISSGGVKNTENGAFVSDILQNKQLMYMNPETNQVFEICGFGREKNGLYYTVEHEIITGNKQEDVKVYHLFDTESNHRRITEAELPKLYQTGISHYSTESGELLHTINSNFELKEAMGGIFSVHENSTGGYSYDDSSSYATCQFLNLVAFRINPEKKRTFDQEDYYQPLKDAMIHYAVNNTAVKNGAGNINQESDWGSTEVPSYMTVGYDGIGVQMDANHEADESLLREFSQVISSLDANGNVHDKAKRVFESLQRIARQASITEMEALEQFIQKLKEDPDSRIQELSRLYDFVARAIINNFKSNNEASLGEDVILAAKKYFDQNLNHLQDAFKVPFSDPGVFSSILPVFASMINNKSVKRQYPGSGYVMCPGYNMRQIYEIDGYKYQESDIINLIKGDKKFLRKHLRQPNETFVAWERRIMSDFLRWKQDQLIKNTLESGDYTSRTQFHPTDNVLIRLLNTTTNEYEEFKVSLQNVDEYVIFTNDYWWMLLEDNKVDLSKYDLNSTQFFKDITLGRDLAPQKISWKDKNGKIHTVFEREEIRKGFTAHIYVTRNIEGNIIQSSVEVPASYAKYDIDQLKDFLAKIGYDITNIIEIGVQKDYQNKDKVQDMFEQLSEGTIDGEQIYDLENKSSEVIMSSMHKSKFPNRTLPYILRNQKVFNEKPPSVIAGFENYHIALVDHGNKHSFITFDRPNTSKREDGAKEKEFRHIRYVEEVIVPAYTNKETKEVVPEKKGIVIYAIDKETSINQYPIGILEESTKKEAYKDNGDLKDGYIILNDKIYKQRFFLRKYVVPHIVEGENNERRTVYQNVYYINKKLIQQYYGTVKNIGGIISKLYEQLDSKEIRVNLDQTKNTDYNELYKIFDNINLLYKHENTLISNIKTILRLAQEEGANIDELKDKYNELIAKRYKEMSEIKRVSFLRSLEVICSRIPAQSLQSFLKGEIVGFLDIDETQAYVSHWQLYLQGSDYDIDKSYIMGASFTKHGLYQHWSPLFDFSNLQTLKASEAYLPISSSKIKLVPRKHADADVIDILDFIKRYNDNPITTEEKIQNIKLYSEFLQFLEKQGKDEIQVYVSDPEFDQEKKDSFYDKIKSHLEYTPTETAREASIRNSIQSGITSIVSDLRNAVHAYSPITLDDIEQNPTNAKIMSLMNPITVYRMQVENMVGKDVIGISAAAGEKVFFTLTYYWNEVLRSKDKNKINNLCFTKTISRIIGRDLEKNDMIHIRITGLYDEEEAKLNEISKAFNSRKKSTELTPDIEKLIVEIAGTDELDILKYNIDDAEKKSKSEKDKNKKIEELINNEKDLLIRANKQLTQYKIKKLRSTRNYLDTYVIDSLSNVNFAVDDIIEYKNMFGILEDAATDVFGQFGTDISKEDFNRELKKNLKRRQALSPKADLFISQLLSAATDNAKELILAQINCGSDLAGVYMYLLSLGIDIKDIVAFMTSPAMMCVHKLSQTNMFNEDWKQLKITDVLNILLGNFKIIGNVSIKNKEQLKEAIENVRLGRVKYDDRSMLFIKTIINSLGTEHHFEEFYADLQEYSNLINGIKEHSNLSGIFLKLNQGLPTSQEDLLEKMQRIQNLVKDRTDEVINLNAFKRSLRKEGITLTIENIKNGTIDQEKILNSKAFIELVQYIFSLNPKLDVNNIKNTLIKSIFKFSTTLDGKEVVPMIFRFSSRQWLIDDEYKKDTIDFYNIIKDTWNVFDVIDKTPQYKELVNLLKLVYVCNDQLSVKSKVLNIVHDNLMRRIGYIDKDKQYRGLMDYVDDRIIYSFLTTQVQDFKFTIPKYFGIINKERIVDYNSNDETISINSIDDVANFKRFMEEYLIPSLQNPNFDTTELFGKNENISDNEFISNLIKDVTEEGTPYYKLDIDMFALDSANAQTLILYENMMNGLDQLSKYTYNGKTLAEWFLLYNLVVNKNKYGNDRMTTIFKSFIDSKKSGAELFNRFYKYIANLDYGSDGDPEKILGINYSDIYLYIAPYVSKWQEQNSLAKIIKQRSEDGSIIYKYRVKTSEGYTYREMDLSISRRILVTQTEEEREESNKNSIMYYLRTNPNQDNYEYFRNKLDSKNLDEIFEALTLLEMNNILFVQIKC